jgi:hypothetical protein
MIYSTQGENAMFNTLLKWLGFKNPMPVESEPVAQSVPVVQTVIVEEPKVEAEKPAKVRKKRTKKNKN